MKIHTAILVWDGGGVVYEEEGDYDAPALARRLLALASKGVVVPVVGMTLEKAREWTHAVRKPKETS